MSQLQTSKYTKGLAIAAQIGSLFGAAMVIRGMIQAQNFTHIYYYLLLAIDYAGL